MGQIIELRCPRCGKEIRFSLGVGMLDYDKQWLQQQSREAREGKYGEDVQAAALRYPTATVTREEFLCRCRKCGDLEGGTLLQLKRADGSAILTIKPSCARCGGATEIVDPDEERIKCPDCQTEMQLVPILLFD